MAILRYKAIAWTDGDHGGWGHRGGVVDIVRIPIGESVPSRISPRTALRTTDVELATLERLTADMVKDAAPLFLPVTPVEEEIQARRYVASEVAERGHAFGLNG